MLSFLKPGQKSGGRLDCAPQRRPRAHAQSPQHRSQRPVGRRADRRGALRRAGNHAAACRRRRHRDRAIDRRFTRHGAARRVARASGAQRRAARGAAASCLKPIAEPLVVDSPQPFIVMLAGVNGSGKTTSIGKLAKYYQQQGKIRSARRGRHFSRRGARAAAGLGRAQQRGGDRAAIGRCRRGDLRCDQRRAGAQHRHRARATPPGACRRSCT